MRTIISSCLAECNVPDTHGQTSSRHSKSQIPKPYLFAEYTILDTINKTNVSVLSVAPDAAINGSSFYYGRAVKKSV